MVQPEPSPKPGTIRVLHVDDEETQRKYAKAFLEMADESIHVKSAVSPEEALRLLKTEAYDCVVSEFQMPGMDGVELARRIQETSDIPFIIYTGRGSEEAAEAAFKAGIDGYIRKETNSSHYRVLVRRIRSVVEKKSSDRELRERHNLELVAGVQRTSSMVRHDIRGSLQTIMNAAHIANSEPEKREEMMGIIMGSVKHVNDIMDDWKNQDFEETLDITEVDLSQLISDSLAASLIPSSVTVDVNVGSMKVSLDKVKMRRVMDNLIRNAIEAMEGGGSLTLFAREGEHEIKIEVSDTGTGIQESELGNLFKPFYTTKPTGGGLGLAYCERAVEAHEGTIDVESKEGEGAKFTISLPKKNEKD